MKSRDAQFWSLAEKVRESAKEFEDSYETAEAFHGKMEPEEIASFWDGLEQRMAASFRWDICAIGAIVQGMLSIDFFTDFQIWLVLQGQDFYGRVLKNPAVATERLPASDPCNDFDFLYFRSAANNVYEDRTGRRLRDLAKLFRKKEPSGKAWSWRDLKEMHPKIWDDFFVKRDRRPKRPSTLSKLKDDKLVWFTVRPVRSWVDIYSDPDYYLEQVKLLSAAQRSLFAVLWMKTECDNGGMDQFFHNSTGIVAREALEGLQLFGAKEDHEGLATIMAAFPGGSPARDRKQRQAQLVERWKDGQMIDDEFPGSKGPELEATVAKYIRAHPAGFFRPR